MNRKFTFYLLIIVSIFMICMAVGCSKSQEGEKPTEHKHTYSQDWTFNGGYHWHEPTCGDTNEVSGKEEHVFIGNNVCRVCGFNKDEYGTVSIDDVSVLINSVESYFTVKFSDPDKAETLEYTYDSSAITLDEEKFSITGKKTGTYVVEAVSAHFFVRFEVEVTDVDFSNKTLYDTVERFGSTIDSRALEWENQQKENMTVFIGDSFFDPWGWANFYSDYAGKNVRLLGISSTTSCHWEQIFYEDLIFKPDQVKPANFVVNIGTNNFYDDNMSQEHTLASIQRMFMIMHQKFPDANIYYFSITQRTNTSYRSQVEATNKAMESWCGYYDWITFMDTASITTSDDLRDGVHLTPEAYRSIFMPAIEEAGCVIADAEEDRKIADITKVQSDKVGSSTQILYCGTPLSRSFILTGKSNVTGTADNGHIEFRFGEKSNSRFLIWNNNSDGIFKITAAYDTGNELIRTLTFDEGLEFDWKLVVTDNDGYLYINNELCVILTEISGSEKNLYVGSEGLDVNFTDMKAITQEKDEAEFDAEIAAMQSVIDIFGNKNSTQTIEFPPLPQD